MPEKTAGVTASALLAALPDTVVVADARGRVTYVNPAISVLLGHAPADLLGRTLTDLLPVGSRSDTGRHAARCLSTAQAELLGSPTQLRALHADGHEVSIDVTLARVEPFPGAGPEASSIVGVLRDASTTILLERQLQVSRYLAATVNVTTALTEAPDADLAFDQLLPTLCDELDWDAATLWQADGGGAVLIHAGTWTAPGESVPALQADTLFRTFRRGEGLPGLVWQRRAPVVIERLEESSDFLRGGAAREDGLRTAVAFPLLRGDTLLGVCELFSFEHRAVPCELVDVLAGAGRQIGQFLARLRAESDVRALADTLQRSLLPSHLPAIPGMEFAARYQAGAEGVFVGGDTYDVMPLPDGRWMVLIADVCGDGAEAAAMTAVTRHTARAAAAGSPGEVLAAVNAALIREQAAGPLRFVTACCLVLRPRPGGTAVQLAVAGHPLPLIRAFGGVVSEFGVAGLPLGVDPDVDYAESSAELPPGTTLMLYTDGVTEARDDAGNQFGEDGLMDVLRRTTGSSAEETVEAVVRAVEHLLRGSRYRADDQAVLAVAC